jgi:hypothetical protein
VPQPLSDALADLRPLLLDPDRLLRAVAGGRRRGATPSWRRVELRPVDLRAGRRLQVVAHDATQAHTRNHAYGPDAVAAVDALLAEPFGNWHVETVEATVQLRVPKKGEAQVHRAAAARELPVSRAHDRPKPRLVDPAEPFLHALGVTDAAGRVKPSRQDKYHQVEELVRALDAVLDPDRLPHPRSTTRTGRCGSRSGSSSSRRRSARASSRGWGTVCILARPVARSVPWTTPTSAAAACPCPASCSAP